MKKAKKPPLYKSFGYAFEGIFTCIRNERNIIESVVDLVTTERKPLAKAAKDTAAGAVLVAAIMAAIVGLIIFVPRIASLL